MENIVAVVGRPNVGKSTLFNRLTGARTALVADRPGVTRDRQYGLCRRGTPPFWVVDTGGMGEAFPGLERQIARALEEAQVVLFMVSAREGLTPEDEALAERLRRLGKPLLLAVNKVDGLDPLLACADFHRLGLPLFPISAAHGHGIRKLVQALSGFFQETPQAAEEGIRFALVGRPNAGKSTLANRMVGEERLITSPIPGTTRDSIAIPLERHGRRFTLIDTAGQRRKAKVREQVERLGAFKARQALERAHVAILVIDAREGVVDQDAHLLGTIEALGKGVVIAVNKWDGLDAEHRRRVREAVARRLAFVDAPIHFISALHGSGVGELFPSLEAVYASSAAHFPTSNLTRLLQEAVAAHPPPQVGGRPIKLRYAHQGGEHPPLVVVHGHRTEALPAFYRRYLARRLQKGLGLKGVPLRLAFKSARNPYIGS